MRFGEKLDILAGIFGIHSNRLARAINVDPSLISKWKSNKRTLKASSVFADRVASYFAAIEAPAFQRLEMFRLVAGSDAQLSVNELKEKILEWLFSEVSTETAQAEDPDASESVRQIISRVKAVPTILSAASSVLASPAAYEVKPGVPLASEIYYGNEGKRQAVMAVLQYALQSPEPLELLCTSQEDMTWLLEDKQYLSTLTKTFIRLFSLGHRLKMIHTLDRNMSDILKILGNWMMLVMTGMVESFYYPRYQSRNLKTTLLIIPDKMGLISICP